MKTKLLLLTLFISVVTFAQYTTIPDFNFENALAAYDDIPNDGQVPTANINRITNLSINNQNISDLTGIQDFTALQTLSCYNNQLTALDVSQNTALQELYCYNNQLTSLNVKNGNNTNFRNFNVINNPNLTCIEVDNPAYSTANWTNIDAQASFRTNCHYGETYVPDNNFENYLETHDANGNTVAVGDPMSMGNGMANDDYVTTANISSVTNLDVSSQNIADMTGIEDFVALQNLNCNYNYSLTSLDVSQNTALQNLTAIYCQLTGLDVSNNTSLISLNVNFNQITGLDVSSNSNLESLGCNGNLLTSLDVSSNPNLMGLWCRINQLTTLDVSSNSNLIYLDCHQNLLTSLNVKNGNNTNFQTFISVGNPNLTCIEVDDPAYSTANWTNIDSQHYFSLNCGGQETYVGLYVNDFKNIIGVPSAETELLNYAQANGFNYLILYNLSYIHNNIFQIDNINSSQPLANFIANAKTNYGILQVAAVGEKNSSFDKIKTYNSFYPSNPEKRFDVFNLEFEYWNDSKTQPGGYYCTTYLQPNGYSCDRAGAFDFYKDQLMLMHAYGASNNIISETYIGSIDQNEANGIAQNTDRILVHYYRQSDVYNNGNSIYQYPSSQPDRISMLGQNNSVNIMPIFSARPNHMQNWLLQPNPLSKPYDTWQNGQNGFNSQTGAWVSNVSLKGYVWYRYTDLLNISQQLGVEDFSSMEQPYLYFENESKRLHFYNMSVKTNIFIYNLLGQQVASFKIENNRNLSRLKQGVYIVKATIDGKIILTQKIMVE